MSPAKRYAKKQTKARQRRRRNAQERLAHDRRQAQQAAAALHQALEELGLAEHLVSEIEGRLRRRIGKINGIFTLPLPPLASGPPLPAAAAHAQHRRLPQAATAARRSGAQQGVVRLCAAGHAV